MVPFFPMFFVSFPSFSFSSRNYSFRRNGRLSWESGKEVALNSRAPGKTVERNLLVGWPQNVLRASLLMSMCAQC